MCTLSICVRVLAIKRRAGACTLLVMAAAAPSALVTVQRAEKCEVADCLLLALWSPAAEPAPVDALHGAENSTRRAGPHISRRVFLRVSLEKPSILPLVQVEVPRQGTSGDRLGSRTSFAFCPVRDPHSGISTLGPLVG